jgi:Fe2+ or Zn2+ uptake regulation protein
VTENGSKVQQATDLPDLLRAHGLRATRPRQVVLEVLRDHPHSDTETVLGLAGARLYSLSTQAGYDVLAALVRVGLARRIEPARSRARFELRVGDNHHHVVCRSCGCVEDVDCARGEVPCLQAADDRGFLIDEAEVTYWGWCPSCRDRRPESAS